MKIYPDSDEISLRAIALGDIKRVKDFYNKLNREDGKITVSAKTYGSAKDYLEKKLVKIKSKNSRVIVAIYNDQLIGKAEVNRKGKRREHVGELTIAILPKFRGQGLGKKLFSRIIKEAKKLGLELLVLRAMETNEIALNLYKKHDFREIGRIYGGIDYKNQRFDEVIMTRRI